MLTAERLAVEVKRHTVWGDNLKPRGLAVNNIRALLGVGQRGKQRRKQTVASENSQLK